MVSAATTIIKNNPGIEKVILLDRTPRFDLKSADPSGLKSRLSIYGNNVFRDELAKTDFKDKIFIAAHSLPSEPYSTVYGDPSVWGFDGIHLYGKDGRKFYTNSLCGILQQVFSRSSRSFHNHLRPISPQNSPKHVSVIFKAPSSSSHSCSPSDPSSSSNDIQHQYSVPVSNMFSNLGNC